MIEGIHREREMLEDIRGRADLVLDTSEWTIHEIREAIYREFNPAELDRAGLTVSLVSFGFKRGIPYGADLLFDVRYLPNPYFVEELRDLTGRDRKLLEFLEGQPDFGELVEKLTDLLHFLLPRFARENRSYLTVAVGCTGGRHRSVAVCERLAETLHEDGWAVSVLHRDVAR